MKSTPNILIRKYQVGGPADTAADDTQQAPEDTGTQEAPQEGSQGGGQDPIVMLAQMAQQALQALDCNAAMQVCQGFLQIIALMQGGAPEGQQGEPVYRKGGILVRRIKK